MQHFQEAGELLDLYGIDQSKPGAQDFVVLADLYGLMSRYQDQYPCTVADLARLLMKNRKLSPMVFWSRMKRAIKPLMEADVDTLRALGIPYGLVRENHERTCPELIAQVGAYCGAFIEIDGKAAEIAATIAKGLGRAK